MHDVLAWLACWAIQLGLFLGIGSTWRPDGKHPMFAPAVGSLVGGVVGVTLWLVWCSSRRVVL